MTLVEGSDDKEYRQKMFGYLTIAAAPDLFYEIRSQHDLHLSPAEWDALSIEERGKHVAVLRLQNMADVLERHEMLQEEARQAEKAERESKKNDKGSQ